SASLPRFLSPGDSISVPLTISNTTAKQGNIVAQIQVEGPLKVLDDGKQNLTVNANSEGRANFKVAAASSTGIGKVKVLVKGLGEKFEDVTEISVRPPSTLQKQSGSGSIVAGKTERISKIGRASCRERVEVREVGGFGKKG